MYDSESNSSHSSAIVQYIEFIRFTLLPFSCFEGLLLMCGRISSFIFHRNETYTHACISFLFSRCQWFYLWWRQADTVCPKFQEPSKDPCRFLFLFHRQCVLLWKRNRIRCMVLWRCESICVAAMDNFIHWNRSNICVLWIQSFAMPDESFVFEILANEETICDLWIIEINMFASNAARLPFQWDIEKEREFLRREAKRLWYVEEWEEWGVGDEMKRHIKGTGIDRIADKMVKMQKIRTRKAIYPIDWLSTPWWPNSRHLHF